MNVKERMKGGKIAVLIPTYNNEKTLKKVIDGVMVYTDQIIIINDGSTDRTIQIVDQFPQLTIEHLSKNQGKGNALRIGFEKARSLGYQDVITIDSDGQHFPEDIPTFLDALDASGKEVLLIGARNMKQEGVPGKSSFGNRFSNFWFWFETGIKLTDTQSGYRLYPLYAIPRNLWTRKFELEIEVIVRTAWRGVEVRNVPIRILYDPSERVSHFRPFRDFTRISVLNTILVFLKIFWILPRDFFRKIINQ